MLIMLIIYCLLNKVNKMIVTSYMEQVQTLVKQLKYRSKLIKMYPLLLSRNVLCENAFYQQFYANILSEKNIQNFKQLY